MAYEEFQSRTMNEAVPVLPRSTANQRLEGDFRHAQQHSFMVRLLKKALPVLAFLVVAWFAITSLYRTEPGEDVVFDATSISDGLLVMEKPRVKGYSSDNQPYNLNAKKALQDLKKPSIVTLQFIDAVLPAGDGSFANLIAKSGLYDTAKEWVSLSQDIVVDKEDGTVINLDTAEIDLKKGQMTSNRPVRVVTPSSKITADNMEITENGSVIIFRERVRMTIQPANSTN